MRKMFGRTGADIPAVYSVDDVATQLVVTIMPLHPRALVWIRRDLRLEDHAALAEATACAERVAVVFIYDRLILDKLEDRDDKRMSFIHRSLAEVAERLREQGSELLIRCGDPVDLIPALANELGVDTVYTNHDFEPYAIARDAEVAHRLKVAGRGFRTFKDHVIFENTEIQPAAGGDYRVFTPYYRAWSAALTPGDYAERQVTPGKFWPAAELRSVVPDALQHPTLQELGFTPSDLWLEPGATAARQRLVEFGETMADYSEGRNFPARPGGTSGLSVHLRHGTISIRECVRFGLAHPGKGADKWVNELGWRDFYHMIMARFPHAMNGAFKPEFDEVPWQDHPEHFEAWCQGRTGYPIVDAAMRCLNATGWMHNRSRMIVASFLTKDLLIHWQRGEAYFARKLLDFELASNNGGWQWASSTGVDAQPHFRIFNPYLQSVKFDPDGVFLREWLPELAALPTKHLHVPSEVPVMELLAHGVVLGETYPYPIVDHAVQRNLAIEMLSSVVKRPATPERARS